MPQLGHSLARDFPAPGAPGLWIASVMRREMTSLILCGGEKGSTDKFIYLSRSGGAERARADLLCLKLQPLEGPRGGGRQNLWLMASLAERALPASNNFGHLSTTVFQDYYYVFTTAGTQAWTVTGTGSRGLTLDLNPGHPAPEPQSWFYHTSLHSVGLPHAIPPWG